MKEEIIEKTNKYTYKERLVSLYVFGSLGNNVANKFINVNQPNPPSIRILFCLQPLNYSPPANLIKSAYLLQYSDVTVCVFLKFI